jgi:hypothetical protein
VAAALLACCALPPAALLAASVGTSRWTAWVGAHPFVSEAFGAVLVAVALLAFDPPRSASPLVYARQLRARFLELQSTFDADDRRRPGEGKEKEDDRVPSEP